MHDKMQMVVRAFHVHLWLMDSWEMLAKYRVEVWTDILLIEFAVFMMENVGICKIFQWNRWLDTQWFINCKDDFSSLKSVCSPMQTFYTFLSPPCFHVICNTYLMLIFRLSFPDAVQIRLVTARHFSRPCSEAVWEADILRSLSLSLYFC